MRDGSPVEVFQAFLKLGLTAFGGPIAHLGYFRDELVIRRRWVDDAAYTDLVALCQFLPGPSSSQVGFSMGMIRAGYWGGFAAWLGFTLPSALFMTGFAFGAGSLHGPVGAGLLHGLKLVAVAIVGQAVWGMARTLCPDRQRAAIGALAAALILWTGSSLSQIGAIAFGGVIGLWLCRGPTPQGVGLLHVPVSRRAGRVALCVYAVLPVALPLVRSATPLPGVALFEAFYRAGALVFGGGHVVLPLLRDAVSPDYVGDGAFLAGYGAAQALPGPLFTFAAYLGVLSRPGPHGVAGAAVALTAIFLPGLLIVSAMLPFWDTLRFRRDAQAMMRGINAAVVGLLGAALYSPIWTGSVLTARDASVAIAGFVLLTAWRTPPVVVVVAGAMAGVALSTVTG